MYFGQRTVRISKRLTKLLICILFHFNYAAGKQQKRSSVEYERLPVSSNEIARVTIHCPEEYQTSAVLVCLPESIEELLEVGSQRFGFSPTKVQTKDGALINDIKLIRDGDHLMLSGD